MLLNVNGLYRHFKTGNLYMVNTVALEESNPDENDPKVVYTALSTGKTWIRPYSSFMEDVSDREDNSTGQRLRFEPATDLRSLLSFISTKELIDEVSKREDNPYSGAIPDSEDSSILNVGYILGRITEQRSLKGDEPYEEFVPITPTVWDSSEQALNYREKHYPNRPCILAKRIIKKCSDF